MRAVWLALLVIGCGGSSATPQPSAPPPAPAVEPEPEREPPPPRTLTDAELDAMERPELEAACYEGSTAACDRLGH